MIKDTLKFQHISDAAVAGGLVLTKYFGQSLEVIQKSMASDFKTKADEESETEILRVLATQYPDYNIYSEELGKVNKGSEYTFVIDPLDGTNNFVLGIPNFSVSIALLKNEEIVAGVIHVPFLKQTFHAEKGKGCFVGNKKLAVSQEEKVSSVSVSVTSGYSTSVKYRDELVTRLDDIGVKRVLINWSPAYDFCLLASGKIEGIINNDTDLYDYAAGKLIATEAGAIITDFKGNKTPDTSSAFVASNHKSVHDNLLTILL